MSETLATAAVVVVAIANLGALFSLGYGLLKASAADARTAVRGAFACGFVALALWFAIPALNAAAQRSDYSRWSPEERKMVQSQAPDVTLDPKYDVNSLFDTFHFWPLPFLVAGLLRYRQSRLTREERKSALTDLSE